MASIRETLAKEVLPKPFKKALKSCNCCVVCVFRFQCTCTNEYNGTHCEIDVDICGQLNPCENGAKCTNLPDDYECRCADGYRGRNCELDYDMFVVVLGFLRLL